MAEEKSPTRISLRHLATKSLRSGDKMKKQKKETGNVVLIGFMGCGKTTAGIRLSYRLRQVVLDTDKLIEQRQGCSVREIFEKDGEAAFREMETDLRRELSETMQGKILAVGGGTPMLEVNRQLLKKIGTVIYLRVRPETVYVRLRKDTARPLLCCEDPLTRIRELMEQRKERYEAAADIIIDVDGLTLGEVVDYIVYAMEKMER